MRLAAGSYWGAMRSVVRLPSRSTTTFAGVVALQPAVGVPAHAWRLTTRRRRSWRSMISLAGQAWLKPGTPSIESTLSPVRSWLAAALFVWT